MTQFKLKIKSDCSVTWYQDDNVFVGTDKFGNAVLETRWHVASWLNDDDDEQLFAITEPDSEWTIRKDITSKILYSTETVRLLQLHNRKVLSYVLAVNPVQMLVADSVSN